ncbi:hypothetical protein [Pseudomonas sp. PDM22]|uniref:hypothetical protein n=1 Tax=Pseudomonas sp. PDM22 TaxID=2769287 RepID=UPI00111C0FB2|nr:hypothetical protein [Pseudomonas sp. PDM22]MBD9516910.1 hypothetical protein [Pseudomonas sp. PDM22]
MSTIHEVFLQYASAVVIEQADGQGFMAGARGPMSLKCRSVPWMQPQRMNAANAWSSVALGQWRGKWGGLKL